MELAGKTVVVTGGGSGIGRAAAIAFAREGCRVAIWDRDDHRAHAVAEMLEQAIAVPVDLSDPDAVRDAVAATQERFQTIDVLVASAAVGSYNPIVEVSDQEWHRVMRTDLDGVFWCVRDSARVMLDRGAGSIILIASDRGLQPEPGWTPYCVAKAGVIQLGKAAALEFAPHIRVNMVCPGPTDTPLIGPLRAIPGLHEKLAGAPLLGRLATPEEIAALIVFVAGHDFMTGAVIPVDGGMSLAGTIGIHEAITTFQPEAGRPKQDPAASRE